MNILMISPYFYPDGGGAEFYMYKIAEKLSAKHDITVLCTSNERKHPLDDDKIQINTLRSDFKVSTTPIKLTLAKDIVSYIRDNDFDICNINYYLPFFPDMAAIACKICNLPSVITWHNDVYADGLMKVFSTLYNHTFNKITLNIVDKVITPSPYSYNESDFLKGLNDKTVWIPPGVDLEKYDDAPVINIREKWRIPYDHHIILFVGVMNRATTHKGVEILLRAFQKIYNEKKAVLVMVGKGDMIDYYKGCCEKLGIKDKVLFTGFIEEEILINFYRESNILVLPSKTIQEGFGMVLIEANACGKPVIGSRVGGIKYVIRDGETGLLVPPGDPEALADAIRRLIEDPEKAEIIGQNGRKMVEENYTWKRSAEMTEKVFMELIN